MTELVGRIVYAHILLSPKLWILGARLSPDPGVKQLQETGYPEPSPAQGFFCKTLETRLTALRQFKTDVEI